LDELFEVWTTGVLALHRKPIVLLNVDGFYDGLVEWLGGLAAAGFVRPDAQEVLTVTDSLPAAFDTIEARLAGRAVIGADGSVLPG
jgi:hypothetical protein